MGGSELLGTGIPVVPPIVAALDFFERTTRDAVEELKRYRYK
jgi:hypothetical protein